MGGPYPLCLIDFAIARGTKRHGISSPSSSSKQAQGLLALKRLRTRVLGKHSIGRSPPTEKGQTDSVRRLWIAPW